MCAIVELQAMHAAIQKKPRFSGFILTLLREQQSTRPSRVDFDTIMTIVTSCIALKAPAGSYASKRNDIQRRTNVQFCINQVPRHAFHYIVNDSTYRPCISKRQVMGSICMPLNLLTYLVFTRYQKPSNSPCLMNLCSLQRNTQVTTKCLV